MSSGRRTEHLGWSVPFVLGGAAISAALFGLGVAALQWLGDPLRFDGVETAAWILQISLCLAWSTAWLALRWSLKKRRAESNRERAGIGLEMACLGLAPLGLLAFAIPRNPSGSWIVPLAVGAVAALGALSPLLGFVGRRELVSRLGTTSLSAQLLGKISPGMRAARGILLVLGLALCTLAAARPRLHQGTRLESRRGIDIIVALDFSKSMLARDIPPSRIELAKMELDQFIGSLGGDRVGLVAFAGEAVQFPLTTDYEAATLFWRDLDPMDMPVGGTALGRALASALRLFENDRRSQSRSKVIVLLTDGEDHEGDPVAVARQAGEQDVQIHVLGIGGSAPELIPRLLPDGTWSGFQQDGEGEYVTTSLTEENEGQLVSIADASGGSYFRAAPGEVGVDHIRQEIRRLRQEQLEERRIPLYAEAFQHFLLFGFLALLASSVLPRGRVFAGGKARKEGT